MFDLNNEIIIKIDIESISVHNTLRLIAKCLFTILMLSL